MKNIIYGKDSEKRIKRECSWVFYKIRYEYYSINFVCLVVLIVENLGKMTKLIIRIKSFIRKNKANSNKKYKNNKYI